MQKKGVKNLIVNADDIGLSASINEAARDCYNSGSITGVSVISCGSAFREGAAILRDIKKTDVGVHLTLTGGFPPREKETSRIKGLLAGKRSFVKGYGPFLVKYLRGTLKTDEIYRELKAQVSRVKDVGLTITHLDSHEHVHMLPPVLKVTLELAKEFDVPYIRLPLEPSGAAGVDLSMKDLARYAGLKVFAYASKKRLVSGTTGCNDAFLGHFHSGRMNKEILLKLLDIVPEGVCELAMHPGVMSPKLIETSPWHRNAQQELDILLDEGWMSRIEERGITLVSHKGSMAS
ncbi:MAG: ChbG/HpnK family deacetylase [Candidatus Tantalella remota]|nr:ChbG/HpnK family deacetylase [Candidatus Tantalella remota]